MLERIGPAVLKASNQPFQAAYDEQSVPGLSSGCGFVDSVIAGEGRRGNRCAVIFQAFHQR